MPLGAPSIVDPVSTCSETIQVRGQFSHSRVRIFIRGDPNPIADKQVTWSDVAIAIDRSRLAAGQMLIATQELAGEKSLPSAAKPVYVEAAINGQVSFSLPLHVCGRSVMLFDCSPGAELNLLQGSALLGKTKALGEIAQLDLFPNKRISAGTVLKVQQKICTSPVLVDTLSGMPTEPPIGANRILPKPMIERPVKACHRLITIRKIVPGAIVRLLRRGQPIFESACPIDMQRVVVEGLAEGEELAVDQEMPRCEIQRSDQDRLRVSPTSPIERPRIDGPLCAGLGRVIVSRLEPGALVRVYADGQEIGRWEAWDRSCPFDLKTPIPPAKITAQQELCGVLSLPSRPYTAASGRSGRWFVVEDSNGDDLKANAFAIHAALLHSSEIVLFSGSQHDPIQGRPRANPPGVDHTEVFDCQTLSIRKIGSPEFDTFCCGHALLPDGRLLVAGGTELYQLPLGEGHFHQEHFPGLSDAALFNPMATGSPWSNPGRMPRGGRWYPTLVTLASGEILVLSGHPENADRDRHNNHTMLLFRPTATNPWQVIGDSAQIPSAFSGYLYPRLHVLPGGNVFSSTPVLSGKSARWTPGSDTTWHDVATAPTAYGGFDFTSILLPLLPDDNYRAQVAVFGAGNAPPDPPPPPPPAPPPPPTPRGDPAGHIIDFGTTAYPNPNPTWAKLPSRAPYANNRRRMYVSAVILPTAEVFVCGGVVVPGLINGNEDNSPVLDPEMLVRNPNGAWRWSRIRRAASSIPRNYHSTALLMPDGRVWTAGSNIGGVPGGTAFRRLQIEIYEPWYMCRQRPVIRAWTTEVQAGTRIQVKVHPRWLITRLAIIRCGSFTHAFNGDQRYVGLADITRSGDSYVGRVPQRDIAIPGYYLLFAVTDEGVPSLGKFIRVH